MTVGISARPARRWLLVGLLVSVPLLLWPTAGLLLGVVLLGLAIAASIRTPAGRAWAEYLCGFGIVVLLFTIAVTVNSPSLWALVVVACPALALVVAALGLGPHRRNTVGRR
jgi:hypothetical protein